MTEDEFNEGAAAVKAVYPETRVLSVSGTVRPLRVGPIPIPVPFWVGGVTRLLVLFDLSNHGQVRPAGFLGDEWKLPGGGAPYHANPIYQHGEAWQGYSWTFPWPPVLGVLQTVEAYLGRLDDRR